MLGFVNGPNLVQELSTTRKELELNGFGHLVRTTAWDQKGSAQHLVADLARCSLDLKVCRQAATR
eukprot:2550609-Prymnesium_polylepis.1